MCSVRDELAHGRNQGGFGHVEQLVLLAGRQESGLAWVREARFAWVIR